MEKAIEIKRRAQRCIQNGDLDGALTEYEKLVGAPDSDPYNYVLLADLLYKKGDQTEAAERYLAAVQAYQTASLYKNAIAVCKKMVRLSLSPARVLHSLATLHALDGLSSEASLYFVQYAEHLVRANSAVEAAGALRQAFDVSQENIRVLEQLSEAWLLAGDNTQAAQALLEAARHYRHGGAEADARRCEARATTLDAGASEAPLEHAAPLASVPPAAAPAETAGKHHPPDPRAIKLSAEGGRAEADSSASLPVLGGDHERMDGLESGRHHDEAEAGEPGPGSQGGANAEPPFPVHGGGVVSLLGADTEDEPGPAAVSANGQTAFATDGNASTYEIPSDDATDESSATAYEIPDDDSVEGPAYEIPAADAAEVAPAYRLAVDDAPGPGAAAHDTPHTYSIDDTPEDGVYEIAESESDAVEVPAVSAARDAAEPTDDVYEIADATAAETPPVGGGHAEPAHDPAPAPHVAGPEELALAHVEELLVHAQHQFRNGERDEASMTLAQAAEVCETIGRLDNAASIYRSLGRGPHATPTMLEMWLANCERRGDAAEAGQVACQLGDRALNEGDEAAARGWFGRAVGFDPDNETALRRIHRLEQAGVSQAAGMEAVAPPAPQAPPPARVPDAAPGEGRVEVAVGRAQAVSFDLAGLLAEFQRGVEAQLAGDAQSHYDLGMTYREMGLLEQAMDSFRCAAQDQAFAARALEMVGRCMADQGRLPEAADEFRRALAIPGVSAENDGELRYYYGLALAGTGHLADALAELEAAQQRLPGFEDVDQHVADLRSQLGRAA